MREIGDAMRDLISTHLVEIAEADKMPMVGGFVLIAEYFDEQGDKRTIQLRNGLTPWTELGMLELAQMTTRKKLV